ncbi:hypothetical protein BCF46_3891 [Litoreibacter meonggei]|uniref:Uncharacterized protein n=1 Tax=Litoreibacter meonggei TaxID=1049199 RepID=A0A497UYF7_9RHOB|nr:hypothetical protein [Litoreibacter meonggei]RLJ36201.1 hypothetical protein BCF46_3891 [Litoreibacter meonggei]
MKRQLGVLGLTLMMLVVLDLAVAGILHLAETRGAVTSLVRFFEYGRSVPGKLDRWIENPGLKDSLFKVAWLPAEMDKSAQRFRDEDAGAGPVLRSYGMSFSGRILNGAKKADPELSFDLHGGPAAPPNLVYEAFLRDQPNRRSGDIAILGLLSSSVSAMSAMSNRTWNFEQPAPLTYPVFHLDDANTVEGGLRAVHPLVESMADELALREDPQAAQDWAAQLEAEDALYVKAAFYWPGLDASPFVRLVRRALAISTIQDRKRELIQNTQDYDYPEVLRRMIGQFARSARADGLIPVVFLIQSRQQGDPDLLAIARPVLDADDIVYFATTEHFDPQDSSGFQPDGHYTRTVDAMFGEALIGTFERAGIRYRK